MRKFVLQLDVVDDRQGFLVALVRVDLRRAEEELRRLPRLLLARQDAGGSQHLLEQGWRFGEVADHKKVSQIQRLDLPDGRGERVAPAWGLSCGRADGVAVV